MTDSLEPVSVLVAMDFSDAIMERLRAVSPRLLIDHYPGDVPASAWANAEIAYTLRHFPAPGDAPRLKWVQMHTAGIDAITEQPIYTDGVIEITTTSGIHAVPMSEYCLGMMLAFTYQLPRMLAYQREATWPDGQHKIFAPRELRGQTVGIVGYGSVGRELARQCAALGMQVLAIKRDVLHPADRASYRVPGTGDPDGEIPDRIYPPQALASMAAACDFLVLIAPLTSASRHMVDETVLKGMKKTAVLINVARGAVVDEPALIAALTAGRIGGAALDVFETEPLPATSPLWKLPNVIISPHVSGNSAGYHDKTAAVFAENLRRYLDKQPLINRVRREAGY